jgi:two-component system, OmpR family, sensor kinase
MSLRARLLLAFAYVLVLVIVALEVPLGLNLSRRVDAEIRREAQGQAQLLAAGASGRLDDRAQLRPLVESSARDLGGRVIVVDENGTLLADSARGGAAGDESYASRPEIARALNGRASQGERHSQLLDEDLLFTAVPIVVDGRPVGAVRVTQGVDAVQREVRNDVIALIGVGVVALLLGLAVAWLLAGSLAKPMRHLASSARRVARGDLDARADVEGSTEQQEVATAFNDMTARLGRSLRAQREFVANASHQLRTPLTGLRLRLEAAAAKTDEPDVRDELAAAEHETERLARLLAELLTLAGERERPAPQPVDVGEVAAGAYERWRRPARRSGHLLTVEEGDPVEVRASIEDVAAMLDNLIENALRYLRAGGRVTIGWRADGKRVRIGVEDEGRGIDESERERVFERFYRGSASRGREEGTGLGLNVVEALAGRWGGEASLSNRAGGGARAEIVLPAHSSLPAPDPQLDEALPGRG